MTKSFEQKERLLITVEAPESNEDFTIYAAIPSKNWLKRLLGMNDYVPMQITHLKTEPYEQSHI